MLRFGSMLATTALLLSADVSGVIRLRPPADERVEFPPARTYLCCRKCLRTCRRQAIRIKPHSRAPLTSNLEEQG